MRPARTWWATQCSARSTGAITTFAVIAGSVGAGFSSVVVIVLGFASLMADGLSMAVSNYLRAKSERERVEQARRKEERHIDVVPEAQEDEVRHIFAEKGFAGETLERIVTTITQNRQSWVDTVVSEEFGLQLAGTHPWRAGIATFFAFLLVGSIPLVPFVLPGLPLDAALGVSIAVTGTAFLAVGMVKGHIVGQRVWRAGLETLVTGGAAAVLAYAADAGCVSWSVSNDETVVRAPLWRLCASGQRADVDEAAATPARPKPSNVLAARSAPADR